MLLTWLGDVWFPQLEFRNVYSQHVTRSTWNCYILLSPERHWHLKGLNVFLLSISPSTVASMWFTSWLQDGCYKSLHAFQLLSIWGLWVGGGKQTLGVFHWIARSFPRKLLWHHFGQNWVTWPLSQEGWKCPWCLGALGIFRAFPFFITYTLTLYF